MKNLSMSVIALLTFLSTFSQHQLGVNLGVNTSWFAGNGVKYYQGINKATVGLKTGIYDKISLGHNFSLNVELNYLRLGQRNPAEHKINFTTDHINLPISLVYNIRYFNVNAGMYVNRIFRAGNRWFPGNNLTWSPEDWDYYRKWNYGFTAGFGFDLIGAQIEVRGLYSAMQVRRVYYNDPTLWGSHDEAVSITINVPFKTLFSKN